jgi:hypothetical protein
VNDRNFIWRPGMHNDERPPKKGTCQHDDYRYENGVKVCRRCRKILDRHSLIARDRP